MNDISKKIYTYTVAPLLNKNVGTSPKGNDMPEHIKALVDALKNAESREDMVKVFADAVENGDIEKLDPITYRSGDYFIQDKLSFRGESEGQILKELTKKNISIVPQYVDSVTKGDYTTLVTKIEGMNGEDLIPFSQGYNLLDTKAKSDAFQDVKKLVQANLINQAIFTRGNGALFVTPKTKKIVVPYWNMMRTIEPNEKQPILNEWHRILFNK